MNESVLRVLELHRQGYVCSQIMIIMGLEALGKPNPDLVRAVYGLGGGGGFCGNLCGALSGGLCLLGLYAGKREDEGADPEFYPMTCELVEWFEERYRGADCRDVLGKDPGPSSFRATCSTVVLATYEKVKEILLLGGYPV